MSQLPRHDRVVKLPLDPCDLNVTAKVYIGLPGTMSYKDLRLNTFRPSLYEGSSIWQGTGFGPLTLRFSNKHTVYAY